MKSVAGVGKCKEPGCHSQTEMWRCSTLLGCSSGKEDPHDVDRNYKKKEEYENTGQRIEYEEVVA